MSLAIVYSRAQRGIDAPQVTVEVHLANGLPSLSIVGLPETAVRESKDRVRSALLHSGFDFPAKRITINLAPADLPKGGGRYDLAIALGVLAASDQVSSELLDRYEFIAELALSGELRPVQGILPSALTTIRNDRSLICSIDNGPEAALAGGEHILSANHLLDVCAHLNQHKTLAHPEALIPTDTFDLDDLVDVRGQSHARRALEIAATGGHSLLFIGPPGTGKTLLAHRLPGILPPLSQDEALEVAAIASISKQGFKVSRWQQRSFRAPHHSASSTALVGGGADPAPGEVSLAHRGVLFLDELPEFKRSALEGLREPMENGSITISRAAYQSEFPARFQLIAAMNPCPCGYWGDPERDCRCSAQQIQRYQARISGPLLDRIDLQVQLTRIPWKEMQSDQPETSASVRLRVRQGRQIQHTRGELNATLSLKRLDQVCALNQPEEQLLQRVIDRFKLSPRSIHRILKVARTIADLDAKEQIQATHLGEAVGYRCLDR